MAEYIEREALIEKINREKRLLNSAFPKRKLCVGDVLYCIFTAPAAVVVEVRHGYWDECECSVCGKMHPSLYLDEWELEYRIKETPYCPNCGAKMDGKGEGE